MNEYIKRNENNGFVTYGLVGKQPISSTASIFHLEPVQKLDNDELYREAWKRGIWNVQFKQPQLQIVRAYTPLPPIDQDSGADKGGLSFLIRRDLHGEVSSYLHRLPEKSNLDIRGPYMEYEITPDVRQVIFLAGGTGIAPALQVAHTMFEAQGGGNRRLHILWANRTREDCAGGINDPPPPNSPPQKSTWTNFLSSSKSNIPTTPVPTTTKSPLVRDLETLKQKYPDQITVEYFVNSEDTWIDKAAVTRAVSRFDDSGLSSTSALETASSSETERERQILISGPPGFIAHLAGPKEWRNGREEQGAVSTIVAHALAKTPYHVKVWKI